MGTVVMGKVESGSVCKGSQFAMMPNRVSLYCITYIITEGRNTDIVTVMLMFAHF